MTNIDNKPDAWKAEDMLGRDPQEILCRAGEHTLRALTFDLTECHAANAAFRILTDATAAVKAEDMPTPYDIRKDVKIGTGTCSTWDECYENSELIESIRVMAEGDCFMSPITGKAAIIAEMRRVNESVLGIMAERDAECGW